MISRGGLLACIAIVVIGCSSGSPDALVGEYGVQPNGPAEIKVSKVEGKYLVSLRQGGGWSEAAEVPLCDDRHYSDLFGSEWKSVHPVGLCATSAPFAIFKVRKGARARGRTFQTGYFMVSVIGGGDAHRL